MPFDVPLPSYTAVLAGADVVDDNWRSVHIGGARKELEDVAIELGHALLTRVEQQSLLDADADDEGIRVLRAGRALVCALGLKRTRLDARWTALVGKAMALHIFPVASGAHISLAQALAERPASLERFLHEEGFPPAAQTSDAPLDSMGHDLAKPPVVPAPTFAQASRRPPPPPPPPPAPPSPPPSQAPAPPPSPEIELSSRIAETMSLVKLDRDAEVELARWPVVVRKNGNKRGLVAFDRKTTIVDADHPLARAALADDADPAALFMLAAVVYGAINARTIMSARSSRA